MAVRVCVCEAMEWRCASEFERGSTGCTGMYLSVFEHQSVGECESLSEYECACMNIGGLNVK